MLALALKPIDLTFQENGHIHLLNGCAVPGCTSISGLFQDDGWKFAWPVKLMAEKIMEWWKNRGGLPCSTVEFGEIVLKAKNAWRKKRDSAAAKGTSAHEYIQDYIHHGVKVPPTVDPEVRHCFDEFLKWEATHNPTYLAVELQVGSEKHKHAGILDILCKINDRVVLLDEKTSKDIKPEYTIQLAGLIIALEEMGVHVDDRAILHLPKSLKESYEYRIIDSDLELDKRAFLAGLEFYKHRNIFFARTKLKEAA